MRSRKRRQVDLHHIEPMIQVFAKRSFGHARFQRAIRRGDDAHVHRNRLGTAHALKRARLQHAQQLRLHVEIDVGDLVQKQRAGVGALEPADVTVHRAREGALLVAEQLALQKLARQGGAIECDKWFAVTPTRFVNRAGDQFLARSRFAVDQHIGKASRRWFGSARRYPASGGSG